MKDKIQIQYVPVKNLKFAEYNPRKISEKDLEGLIASLSEFGTVDPLLVNNAPGREGIVIGGNQRLLALRKLGQTETPVVFLTIPSLNREKELNIRLNRNQGEWDFGLLAKFDETLLKDIGFSSEELDTIFDTIDIPEQFDLVKELRKLDINKINFQKGDVYTLGDSLLMCGDSTVETDVLKLMGGEKADMCYCDPPYILQYLKGGKRHGNATTGFGAKKNRRYLETDILPPDFTEKWMSNVKKIAKDDFNIIVFENWKNIRTIWNEMEKYWRVKNMIVWHLKNRTQGFASKYRFFSKHDIAMVGVSENFSGLNLENEEKLLQNEYETALYASSGKPQWEGYSKGKKICPTDFIEFNASDEKSSGQGIIFGTKPIEILIPYIKVLTKRNDLIIEPFGGSGSTLIAATKMKRRCYVMEKSPVYCEVIKKRWENLTGMKGVKING
jgi:DNA modification methylase